MERNPGLFCFLNKIYFDLIKKLIQVEWSVLFFLTIDSNFSWNSTWNGIIRFHYFRLDSKIKVIIVANSWGDSFQLFHSFSFLLGFIFGKLGLFTNANSFGYFLSLLRTNVKTFIGPCSCGIMINYRIIGIDDLWIHTSLFIGGYGTVIHLDIQTIKIKNLWIKKVILCFFVLILNS